MIEMFLHMPLVQLFSKFLRSILIVVGCRIPTKCPFRAMFKLNWTPCQINPFYHQIVLFAVWARNAKSSIDFPDFPEFDLE
jgi:hypothetical protein